jgi:hypothetical protein
VERDAEEVLGMISQAGRREGFPMKVSALLAYCLGASTLDSRQVIKLCRALYL